MSEDNKQVRYDIDGNEVLSSALIELINNFPGIAEGDEIAFSTLNEDSGKAMFPVTGAIIETEKKSITGHVSQICLYPFYVIYRGSFSESRKLAVKEWLDNLGKWLERQTVIMNGESYKLEEYPTLTGDRELLSIERLTPAYLDSVNENKSENWAVQISARYNNEYDM